MKLIKILKNNLLFSVLLGFLTLITTQVSAQDKVPSLQDLVGVRGSSGEMEMKNRGFEFLRTDKSEAGVYMYWREVSSGKCVTVRLEEGRYQSLIYAPGFDCQNSSSNESSSNKVDRSINCKFNGQSQKCEVNIDRSEASTLVEITFPDGFTRKMTFEMGDFYSQGLQVTTNLERGLFMIQNDNKEYFEIPRTWFD